MPDILKEPQARTRTVRKIARIWGALIIAYVALLAIGMVMNLLTEGEADPYAEEDIEPIEYSGPILMLLSAVGLALAWRFEGPGAGIVVASQVLFIIFLIVQHPVSMKNQFIIPLILSLFVLVPGLLLFGCWRRSNLKSS